MIPKYGNYTHWKRYLTRGHFSKYAESFFLLKVKIVRDSPRIPNMHAIYPMAKYCVVPELKIFKDIHFAYFV